ncbi:PH domain-containing protein [Nocardioides sp. SR21]|uniref:PH domain-containing protein n=1 Tax=Nocardioides sp. SR21 TaxID=2919501 RepID=UPI001FAA169D|nr:PH domain-containing protein [Nocardioides sp. SR21]
MAISNKLLNPGEKVIIDTRTHVKALLWPLVCLVVLLAVGTYSEVSLDNRTFKWVIWAVLAVGIVWFVLKPLVMWATATYTFTDRRLITRSGVIVRRGHDMPLARISDIAYEFGPIDRLLGCGTLVISDASTHGQIELHDIPQVEDVQRKVNELLLQSHGTPGGHEGV